MSRPPSALVYLHSCRWQTCAEALPIPVCCQANPPAFTLSPHVTSRCSDGWEQQCCCSALYSFETELLTLFVAQMLAPSKATPTGFVPTGNVPSTAPSLARSLVTLLLPAFAIQMFSSAKAKKRGIVPTGKVPSTTPSLARSLVTLLLLTFATQMLAPSKATPNGFVPTPKVASSAPSLGCSLVTSLLLKFATQMLSPSMAKNTGALPTPKVVVRLALYQCRMAIWSGFLVDLFTFARVDTDVDDRASRVMTTKRRDFDTAHLLCEQNWMDSEEPFALLPGGTNQSRFARLAG